MAQRLRKGVETKEDGINRTEGDRKKNLYRFNTTFSTARSSQSQRQIFEYHTDNTND